VGEVRCSVSLDWYSNRQGEKSIFHLSIICYDLFHYCYPGHADPLPTVGYYGMSKGIIDARYLRKLQMLDGAASKSPRSVELALPRQAADFLEQWRSRIDLSPVCDLETHPRHVIEREVEKIAREEYGDLREGTIEIILRLRTASGGGRTIGS